MRFRSVFLAVLVSALVIVASFVVQSARAQVIEDVIHKGFRGRLGFQSRVKLASDLAIAREASRLEHKRIGGRPTGWAYVVIRNQSYDTRKLWISIGPINKQGWFREIWEKESFEVDMSPGGTFTWHRGHFGEAYMVMAREVKNGRWEVVYQEAHVPTWNTYGYVLAIPASVEDGWNSDQLILQAQLNALLLRQATSWKKNPELDAQIKVLRDQIGQSSNG